MFTKEMINELEALNKVSKNSITIDYSLSESDQSQEIFVFLNQLTNYCPFINIQERELPIKPSFMVYSEEFNAKITYAALPVSLEFEPFLFLLNLLGTGNYVLDKSDQNAIEKIDQEMNLVTYMSLSCDKCADLIKTLNTFACINENITHTVVDVNLHHELVENLDIFALPSVYLNNKEYFVGKMSTQDILYKIYGQTVQKSESAEPIFDILVVGGGPAGIAATLYSARKSIKTGFVYDEFGGRVKDITGLENFIGLEKTDGPNLVNAFRKQLNSYDIEQYSSDIAVKIEHGYDFVTVHLQSGKIIQTKALIISTGANRRLMGVPGETEYQNKGVSYCVHCDGPLYKDKEVVVIGGGNQGVQAALALTDIAKKVTISEWSDHLSADNILIERLMENNNLDIRFNSFITSIIGEELISQVQYMNHNSGELEYVDASGVFIMTGFNPNTGWLSDTLELNELGEIIVDEYGRTNRANIFAAGDCTNHKFKQVVVSIGAGTSASLAAYEFIKLQGH